MTPNELESQFLSLRYWLRACVLPSALSLAGFILFLPVLLPEETFRKETAVIFVFFMLYFVFFRGGHLIMIRSMHFDMMRAFGETYEARLKSLPSDIQRRNLGFTLARIKRDLIHERGE